MNIEFPPWYQSSTGPQISQTIFNIVGGFLPLLNLTLASKGVQILPENVNWIISLGVFIYFAIRAGIGYLKSKRALGMRIRNLQSQITRLGAVPEV